MLRILILLSLISIVMACSSLMPIPVDTFAAVNYNSSIYVFGGLNNQGQFMDAIQIFDPITNNWSIQSYMPTPLAGHVAIEYENKIYILGGQIATNQYNEKSYIYTPAINTWTRIINIPNPRWLSAGAILNGSIYIIAGSNNPYATNEVDIYNIKINQWSSTTPVPCNSVGSVAGVIESTLYSFGGYSYNCRGGDYTDVFEFDVPIWNSVSTIPMAQSQFAAVSAGKAIYTFGSINTISNIAQVFTVNKWYSLPSMPVGRSQQGAVIIDNLIYVFGGKSNGPTSGTMNIFDVTLNQWIC